MLFEKDLCSILILIGFLIYFYKYYRLKSEMVKQRKFWISVLSHDFRVPVIAQIRALELIQRLFPQEKTAKMLLEEIDSSCKYSFELVSTLSDIYRAENGENILDFGSFNLKKSLSTIFDELYPLTSDKNITFKNNSETEILTANKKYFIKALKFILRTAINYSDKNSAITFNTYNRENKLYFEIKYTGTPVYPNNTELITSPSDYTAVGHGIQMYFCKEIITLHKGSLSFENISEDKHRFIFNVPTNYNRGKMFDNKIFQPYTSIKNHTADFTNFNIINLQR